MPRTLAVFLALASTCLDTPGVDSVPDSLADIEEELGINITGPGMYLGALCEDSCSRELKNVFCDLELARCECEPLYPVKIGPLKGCAKPTQLGEQCFYYETCTYADQHAECVQIKHNAVCQCKQGYHQVTRNRANKRHFCSQDIMVVTTDASTLLGVVTGLAIFSALICFVLKLFVGDQPKYYANANLAPPILFASENGIPIEMHPIRPCSRASSERSVGSYSQRGSRGMIIPASRAGAARAAAILLISCHLTPEHESRVLSLASVHSTTSTRSYSARRFEREREQRLARERARASTPSPRSTDQLISDQRIELTEWPKGSNNTLDMSEEGTLSDTEVTLFPPLSSSVPADLPLSLPPSEWPPKNL